MQATWRSFCRDRLEAVRGVLAAGRSPPEIAYQLGELLHNHFRTRGVTLTSYELRRLVAELLALHGPAEEGHEPAARRRRTASPARQPTPSWRSTRAAEDAVARRRSGGATRAARVPTRRSSRRRRRSSP